jgi:hypothetical protein
MSSKSKRRCLFCERRVGVEHARPEACAGCGARAGDDEQLGEAARALPSEVAWRVLAEPEAWARTDDLGDWWWRWPSPCPEREAALARIVGPQWTRGPAVLPVLVAVDEETGERSLPTCRLCRHVVERVDWRGDPYAPRRHCVYPLTAEDFDHVTECNDGAWQADDPLSRALREQTIEALPSLPRLRAVHREYGSAGPVCARFALNREHEELGEWLEVDGFCAVTIASKARRRKRRRRKTPAVPGSAAADEPLNEARGSSG